MQLSLRRNQYFRRMQNFEAHVGSFRTETRGFWLLCGVSLEYGERFSKIGCMYIRSTALLSAS
jgi:hypothetical protein